MEPARFTQLVMLDPRERFFPLVQAYFGPVDDLAAECYCSLWDWDQLRLIKVQGTAKFFPLEDDADTSIFAHYLDYHDVPIEVGLLMDDGTYAQKTGERSRRKALAKGQYCFRWERPPQSRSLTTF